MVQTRIFGFKVGCGVYEVAFKVGFGVYEVAHMVYARASKVM